MQLYDYQLDMKHRIAEAFKSHQSVMVQMPTGTGKTYLLASCVYEWMGEHEGEVWIVAHRRELVEQIKETINRQVDFMRASGVRHAISQLRVVSIQWLSRHYEEIQESPSLIVIDEAHHALANTYAELMKAFPQAKKLGVTATPCRLTRKGFTDLFEVLLISKPIAQFIKDGYLADFDYVSLNPNSEDQKKINGLTKRATDGDYSVAEMQEVLDTKPTIERLFQTIDEFAQRKKGIVYAINIEHAEHIAEYYKEHGVGAVAISSKTSAVERREIIERFKGTYDALNNVNTPIHVLVNVDLFNEGFDCPDVEFIQLARPTLSLAKYLQMVGRGLRVAKNKECCTILDNVGLYRLFGLPNAERDWTAMFLGKQAGKGIADIARDWALRVCGYPESNTIKSYNVCDRDMVVITRHDTPRIAEQITKLQWEYSKAEREGRLTTFLAEEELRQQGVIKHCSRKKIDKERPWEDTKNGIRFVKQPRIERHGFLEFSTTDGVRLYPRVQTRLMDSDSFVLPDALAHGIEDGLRFRDFYIPPSANPQLYVLEDQMDDLTLFKDEENDYYTRCGFEPKLKSISIEEWRAEKRNWKRLVSDFEKRAEEREKRGVFQYPLQATVNGYKLTDYSEPTDIRITRNGKAYSTFVFDIRLNKWRPTGSYTEFSKPAYGIRVVRNWEGEYLLRTQFFEKFSKEDPKFDFAELLDDAYLHVKEKGREYYVDLESKMCFDKIPEIVKIGFMRFQKDGDMYFPFNYRLNARRPFRRDEIIGGNDICFIGKHIVIQKGDPSLYYIRRRYTDGKRFVVSKRKEGSMMETLYNLYYDGKSPVEIKTRETNSI